MTINYAIMIENKFLQKDYSLSEKPNAQTRMFIKQSNAEKVIHNWYKEIKWILVKRLLVGMPKHSYVDISSDTFKQMETDYRNNHKPKIVAINLEKMEAKICNT